MTKGFCWSPRVEVWKAPYAKGFGLSYTNKVSAISFAKMFQSLFLSNLLKKNFPSWQNAFSLDLFPYVSVLTHPAPKKKKKVKIGCTMSGGREDKYPLNGETEA